MFEIELNCGCSVIECVLAVRWWWWWMAVTIRLGRQQPATSRHGTRMNCAHGLVNTPSSQCQYQSHQFEQSLWSPLRLARNRREEVDEEEENPPPPRASRREDKIVHHANTRIHLPPSSSSSSEATTNGWPLLRPLPAIGWPGSRRHHCPWMDAWTIHRFCLGVPVDIPDARP